MKKHLTMLLACLFLSIGVALAQTQINGTVVSESDGEPIVGATGTQHWYRDRHRRKV